MSLLSLLLAAAPSAQGAPLPLRPHPSDALLFVELPDVKALLEAYSRAPTVQMAGDDAVQEAVDTVLKASGVKIMPAVSQALAAAGLAGEFTQAPLATARGMLDRLAAASVSVSTADDEGGVSDSIGKTVDCLLALYELQARIGKFTEAHDGFPPGTLEDLAPPPELQVDPWGTPFVLEVDLSSLACKISSLGADGQTGGTGFAADLTTGSPPEELAEAILQRALNLLAHLDFHQAQHARAAADGLSALAERLGWKTSEARAVVVAGRQARVRTLGDPKRLDRSVWLLEQDRSVVLGYGARSLERVLERSHRETAHLAPASPIRALSSHLPEARGATVVRGWALLDQLAGLSASVERALEKSGIESVVFPPLGTDSVFRMQLDGDRFVTEVASQLSPVQAGAQKEILSCVGSSPVPASIWKFVPSEAIGVLATSVDAQRLYTEILKSLGATGEKGSSPLAEMEQRHGFDLEHDIFGSLGPGISAYLLPVKGVLSIPGVAIVAELRDAAAFQRGLDGLLKLLEEQAGGEFSVRYRPYQDQPMWTFSFGGSDGEGNPVGFAVPISPTLSIVRGHLLVTLRSDRAKKEIKRLLAGEGVPHLVLTSEHAPPDDATFVGFMDWAALLEGTYEGARAALPLIASFSGDLPFDLEALPDAATFTRFFKPSTAWAREVGDGVELLRLESSFGPETWLGLLGGGAALGLGVRQAFTHDRVEAEATARDAEVQEVIDQTHAGLDELGTRLEVYRIESGRYPPALEVLLKPTPAYPRGYLPEGVVPVDGWGRDFVYVPAGDGLSFSLWSLGENGADERGNGDDLVLK